MLQIGEFFRGLFETDRWPARWHCGYWSDFHGWLYIISETDGNYTGSGIGLAICRRIVEIHHGRITVESSPGRGSEFIIELPK